MDINDGLRCALLNKLLILINRNYCSFVVDVGHREELEDLMSLTTLRRIELMQLRKEYADFLEKELRTRKSKMLFCELMDLIHKDTL